MSIDTDPMDLGATLTEFALELSQDFDQMQASPQSLEPKTLMQEQVSDTRQTFVIAGAAPETRSDVDSIIMDLPVTLKVVLGTAKMPVAAISKMARGTVIKLDSNVGDPVDIYVNGRLLARGQVVILDEGQSRFGVTLTQVGGGQAHKR
jgi:flagellar motor switch protein FliN